MQPRSPQKQSFADFLKRLYSDYDPKYYYQNKLVLPRAAKAYGFNQTGDEIIITDQNFTDCVFPNMLSRDPESNITTHFNNCGFYNVDVSGGDFQGMRITSSQINGVNFNGCNLAHSLINVGNNSTADFSQADLSYSLHLLVEPKIDSAWNNTNFTDANMRGVVMRAEPQVNPDPALEYCDFTRTNIEGMQLFNLAVVKSRLVNVRAAGFFATNPVSTFGAPSMPSAWFFRVVFEGLFAGVNLSERIGFSECDLNNSVWDGGRMQAYWNTGELDHSLDPGVSTTNQTFGNTIFRNVDGSGSVLVQQHKGEGLTVCAKYADDYITGRGGKLENTTFGANGVSCSTALQAAFIVGANALLLLSLAAGCIYGHQRRKRHKHSNEETLLVEVNPPRSGHTF